MAILVLGCNETFKSAYKTLDQAKADGAIQRGWVPDNLPAESYDIREIHNLDTNWVRGSFSLTSDEFKQFKASLQRDLRIKSQYVDLEPNGADKFKLDRKESTRTLSMRGYEIYTYKYFGYAIHWGQGHGFYWNSK